MDNKTIIRVAKEEDAREILDIYEYYVKETAITFEITMPSLEEMKNRIKTTIQRYPYLVMEVEETNKKEIIGYAYASAFKQREAYDWAVETSIYVKKDSIAKGIGTKLYNKLEEILKKQNIVNINACITYPNIKSINFHEKLGYVKVAHFHKCGYKFGKWRDMIWMEKIIAKHKLVPEKIIEFKDIEWRSL